ncbi:MAG: tetratricopeptide repeat protein [Melioribacteraceae bacterium]|nr:tetratricopeptide repeat protein [Melioribacteraceae bacterium]
MRFFYYILIFLFVSSQLFSQNDLNQENKYRLAESFENAGQLDKAETLYLELINASPNNPLYFDSYNKILVRQKKYQPAIKTIKERLNKSPQDINMYGMLGSIYYYMDSTSRGNEIWEEAINKNHNSLVAYRVIANYAIENRNFDKAIEFLRRGKEVSDDPLIFSIDLANIYAVNMNFKEAAAEYCELVSRKPEQIGLAKSRMQSYLTKPGAIKETIEVVKKYADKNPTYQLLDLIAFLYMQDDNYKDAFEINKKLDKIAGGTGNMIFNFAQDAFNNSEYEIASTAYENLITNFPQSPVYQLALIGKARTAEQAANLKHKNNSEDWKPLHKSTPAPSDIYKEIINSYMKLTENKKNINIPAEALYRSGYIYQYKLIDFDNAELLYKDAIKNYALTNYGVLAALELSKIYIKENRLDDALRYIENLITAPRGDIEVRNDALFLKGKIYFWQGKFEDASKELKRVISNLGINQANDALELAILINTGTKDSLNLLSYVKADLLSEQEKYEEATLIFKSLSENENAITLNNISKFKYAQMLIALNKYDEAIKVLEVLSDNKTKGLYSDTSLFLLSQVYQNGLNNKVKSEENYKNLLEFYPNSLYFDRVREILNSTN